MSYPNDPLESPWKYDGTYQARHLALLDLIRIAAGGGGSGYDFDLLNQETTQLLIKGVLDDLEAKDFATEATLVAIDTVLDAIKVKTDNIDVALSTMATEATQELNRLQLVDLNAKDFATASKQDEIITAVQGIELTSTSDATKLNQYNQIELLTLMYEELQQINKTLKKIYQ